MQTPIPAAAHTARSRSGRLRLRHGTVAAADELPGPRGRGLSGHKGTRRRPASARAGAKARQKLPMPVLRPAAMTAWASRATRGAQSLDSQAGPRHITGAAPARYMSRGCPPPLSQCQQASYCEYQVTMLAGMSDEICPLAAQDEPSETVDRPRSVPTAELWARPVTAVLGGRRCGPIDTYSCA
jgi:hypothetical protein